MKKKQHYYYIILACLMHSICIYSMQTDTLEVTNSHGTTTMINPIPQTWSSFTRHLLKKDLENTINKEALSEKVRITASGKNVALALQYVAENPTKISKLILKNPKINVASGINPFEYYRGNFPLSAIDTSKLISLSITIQDSGTTDNNDVKAIIELCRQANASIGIPNHLAEWYNQMSQNIGFPDLNTNTKDPNAELNTVIFKERVAWLKNKVLFITIAGLFYLLSKKL